MMLRGIYTAASGMNAVQLMTDTMANNLANATTTGFKSRRVDMESFTPITIDRLDKGSNRDIGSLSTGVEISSTPIYFSQGSLRKTDNPLDIAIQGDALFTIEGRNGQTQYTRNGNFTLNDKQELVTGEGLRVLDTSGSPITLPTNVSEIIVGPRGQLKTVGGEDIAQLNLVTFKRPEGLEKVSDSLLWGEEPIPLAADSKTTVIQGFLEQSNTNMISEMLNSITGMRLYESLQRQITQQNQTLGKAVNEVGKPS
ncbi:MAG: flagellar hook-basal body protein [Vampirovibrionales bacterium]